MNEDELIKLMYMNDFSTKQIHTLKKVSEEYSTSLYDTVSKLSQLFSNLYFYIY